MTRERGIGVGCDETGTATDRSHRPDHVVVVERHGDADHDRIGWTVHDKFGADPDQRSVQALGSNGENPLAGLDHRRGSHRSGDDLGLRIGDPVVGELGRNLGGGAHRRIRDERKGNAGRAQGSHRLGSARHGLGSAPDDAVEIERPARQLTSHVGRLRRSMSRSPGPFASCAAASCAEAASPYS